MKIVNVEIKARCADLQGIRDKLALAEADFVGRDHQIDTYYETPKGRLKLRQGNIENALIAYDRANDCGPKRSDVLLYKTADSASLKRILDNTMQRLVVVDKQRDIFFIDNVKFHLDTVAGLGNFVEVEAIDDLGTRSEQELRDQCAQYISLLQIRDEDLVTHSYSDLIINKNQNEN